MTSRRPRIVPPEWAIVVLVAGVLVGSAGCTICPDPFDYTGPVPNGSPPQNDFRARSGGITPLDGVPRPWPPVVRAVPDPADEEPTRVAAALAPTPDATAARPEATPADVQPASAEAPSTGDEAAAPTEEAVEPEVEADVTESDAEVVGDVSGPVADESVGQKFEPSAEAPAEAIRADVVALRPAEAEPTPSPEEPAADEILPPVRLLRQPLAAPLRETPGWRSRD